MKQLKLRLTASYIVCVLAIVLAFFALHKVSLQLYPSRSAGKYVPVAFTDAEYGGTSMASLGKDGDDLALSYTLHSGVEHPSAGIAFPLIAELRKTFREFKDFTIYDSVSVVYAAGHGKAKLVLEADDPKYTSSEPGSGRPLEVDLPSGPGYSEARFALSSFAVPDAWFSARRIAAPDGKLYLDRIFEVRIESAGGSLLGFPGELDLRSLHFYGENRAVRYGALALLVLVTGAYVFALRRMNA